VALVPLDLNALLGEAVAYAKDLLTVSGSTNAGSLHFEMHLSPDLPLVPGAASELREVFVNLLRNAADAMPKGGTISIRSSRANGLVACEVEDAGSGIDKVNLDRIFLPLFSTKGEHGTGLGLSTAHAIMRRHGGDLSVTSCPGQGSRFFAQFPLGGTADPATLE
jgi:two-component system cell cycle sensor histidine kinase/response regulator CckA